MTVVFAEPPRERPRPPHETADVQHGEGDVQHGGWSGVRVGRLVPKGRLAGAVGLAAAAVFVALALFMAGHGAPVLADDTLLTWSVSHRPTAAVVLARVLTATGTGVVPYTLLVIAGVVVGRATRQRLLAAVLGVACLAAAQTVRYIVMTLVARPRPPQSDWQTHASFWAFPSGHATTSAVTAGLLVLTVLLVAPRSRGRNLLAAGIGCWGALVGLSRIYLAVHWSTDVLGGWLFAVAWLGLCGWAAAWWARPGRTRGR